MEGAGRRGLRRGPRRPPAKACEGGRRGARRGEPRVSRGAAAAAGIGRTAQSAAACMRLAIALRSLQDPMPRTWGNRLTPSSAFLAAVTFMPGAAARAWAASNSRSAAARGRGRETRGVRLRVGGAPRCGAPRLPHTPAPAPRRRTSKGRRGDWPADGVAPMPVTRPPGHGTVSLVCDWRVGGSNNAPRDGDPKAQLVGVNCSFAS